VAGYDPNLLEREAVPYLGVVPDGETRPLGEVLKALGFKLARLQQPLLHAFNFSLTLSWRLSPSYELTCELMAPENPYDPFDLRNGVSMVQIHKR
jgi:hypothetical protein